MPFIRQTRDKRGFEHTYVMHAYHGTGPGRPRVLYVFCSPANLRVGRTALDAEVMEALEHTHPDLSFDWNSLTRDAAPARVEPAPDRPQVRRPRPNDRPQQGGNSNGQTMDRQLPREPAATPVPEDQSLLGRTIGAGEAARLRARYSELMQRIGRRSRTPEERDRLFERLRRLNPDEWPDETTVRSQALSVEAGWNEISGQLPSRRRGRRGGRNRAEGDRASSGIMATEAQQTEEVSDDGSEEAPRVADPGDSGVGDSGDDSLGSATAETDTKTDPQILGGD